MKMFTVDVSILILWWHVYCNLSAVNSPNYIWKSSCGYKLRFNFSLFNNSLWELYCVEYCVICVEDIRIFLSHTAGMVRRKVDWPIPERSDSSRWKFTVARNPNVLSTSVGTGNTWLLLIARSIQFKKFSPKWTGSVGNWPKHAEMYTSRFETWGGAPHISMFKKSFVHTNVNVITGVRTVIVHTHFLYIRPMDWVYIKSVHNSA